MRTIAFIALLVIALLLDFRLMNAMLVHKNVRAVLQDVQCPVPLAASGDPCIVDGDLRRHFWSNTVAIRRRSGEVVQVSEDQLRGFVMESGASRYEPFGKTISGVIGTAVLCLPFLLFLRRSRPRTTSSAIGDPG